MMAVGRRSILKKVTERYAINFNEMCNVKIMRYTSYMRMFMTELWFYSYFSFAHFVVDTLFQHI